MSKNRKHKTKVTSGPYRLTILFNNADPLGFGYTITANCTGGSGYNVLNPSDKKGSDIMDVGSSDYRTKVLGAVFYAMCQIPKDKRDRGVEVFMDNFSSLKDPVRLLVKNVDLGLPVNSPRHPLECYADSPLDKELQLVKKILEMSPERLWGGEIPSEQPTEISAGIKNMTVFKSQLRLIGLMKSICGSVEAHVPDFNTVSDQATKNYLIRRAQNDFGIQSQKLIDQLTSGDIDDGTFSVECASLSQAQATRMIEISRMHDSQTAVRLLDTFPGSDEAYVSAARRVHNATERARNGTVQDAVDNRNFLGGLYPH